MSDEQRFDPGDPDAVWTSVARALAGEASAEEQAALGRHLAEHPGRAELVGALGGALRPLSSSMPDVDVESALAKVLARRDAEPGQPSASPDPKVIPFRAPTAPASVRAPVWRRPAVLRLAATALVLLVGAGLVMRAVSRMAFTPASRFFATETGARRSIGLPDGTRVELGPASRLELAQGYGRGARSVALWGEAYFEVKHDAARPFEVRTGTMTIRDVGTAFVVRADSGGASVAVTEGAVSISAPRGGYAAALGAGDRATASAGGITVQRGAASADDVAWTRGHLVFRDEPLRDVAAELKRWYGVTVVVAPPLAGRHVTAEFDAGQSADDVLRVLAAAVGGELQRHGDTADVAPAGGR